MAAGVGDLGAGLPRARQLGFFRGGFAGGRGLVPQLPRPASALLQAGSLGDIPGSPSRHLSHSPSGSPLSHHVPTLALCSLPSPSLPSPFPPQALAEPQLRSSPW